MPKRTDIKSILIVGAGPIVIGQACEFDYSGTQACKALKAEGYRIVLVNSNPATIMTDPDVADATYIEPITPEFLTKIIEKERPDALLPTMGGQTALNAALSLERAGVLKKYGVEMIGARAEVDRQGRGSRAVPRGDAPNRARDAALAARRRRHAQARRPAEIQGRDRPHRGRRHRSAGARAGACHVRGRMGAARERAAPALCRERPDRGARRAPRYRPPGHYPSLLHARRHRRRHRL